MSIVAAIRSMLAAGLTIEQALIAAEAFEVQAPAAEELTARQARNARYYESRKERLKASEKRLKASETSESVLKVSPSLSPSSSSPPITPLITTPPISPPSKTREASPLEILSECLSETTARDLIAHRKAKRSPMTPGAAKALVKTFKAYGDAEGAAQAMMARGWTGFKAEWMAEQPRAGPAQGSTGRKGWGALWTELNGYGSETKRVDEALPVLSRGAVDGNGNGDGNAGGVSGDFIELFATSGGRGLP